MNEIQQFIKEKESEIERLRDDIAALRRAENILKGKSGESIPPASQPKMAVAILEESGKPMHVASIADQMQRKYQQTVKVANLGVMLFRYAKRGKSFYKVKGRPNTYGLIKWESFSERTADRGIEKLKSAS